MASLVQSNVGTIQGTVSTISVAFSSNNTSGNLLVAKLWVSTPNTLSTFADSKGNSWVQQRADLTPGAMNTNFYSYYCLSAGAGANTVTATFSANTYAALYITEAYSGTAGQTWSTDGTTFAVSASPGTSVDSGGITIAGTNDFLVSQINMGSASTVTAGTGWTKPASGVDVFGNCIEYQTTTTTGTYHATATIVTSTNWYCDITAFKASGSPPITPSVSGTISVTGTPAPAITPIYESLSGTANITGIQGVNLDYFVSLSGAVSVTGILAQTFNPVEPNLTGTVSVTGAVTPVYPNLLVNVSGNVNVTGSLSPKISIPISGSVAVSGVLNVTLSPININVSGLISLTGSVSPNYGLVTSGFVSVTGAVNNIQLGISTSGTISESGIVTLGLDPGLGVSSSGLIGVSGNVFPVLPAMNITVSGSILATGTVNLSFDPGLGAANPGLIGVSGSVVPTNPNLNISISGSANVTGAVQPEPIFASSPMPINVTGAVVPAIVPAVSSGLVSVSGSVNPAITPIFVTLSGSILVTGGLGSTAGKGVSGSLIGPYNFWGAGYD